MPFQVQFLTKFTTKSLDMLDMTLSDKWQVKTDLKAEIGKIILEMSKN